MLPIWHWVILIVRLLGIIPKEFSYDNIFPALGEFLEYGFCSFARAVKGKSKKKSASPSPSKVERVKFSCPSGLPVTQTTTCFTTSTAALPGLVIPPPGFCSTSSFLKTTTTTVFASAGPLTSTLPASTQGVPEVGPPLSPIQTSSGSGDLRGRAEAKISGRNWGHVSRPGKTSTTLARSTSSLVVGLSGVKYYKRDPRQVGGRGSRPSMVRTGAPSQKSPPNTSVAVVTSANIETFPHTTVSGKNLVSAWDDSAPPSGGLSLPGLESTPSVSLDTTCSGAPVLPHPPPLRPRPEIGRDGSRTRDSHSGMSKSLRTAAPAALGAPPVSDVAPTSLSYCPPNILFLGDSPLAGHEVQVGVGANPVDLAPPPSSLAQGSFSGDPLGYPGRQGWLSRREDDSPGPCAPYDRYGYHMSERERWACPPSRWAPPRESDAYVGYSDPYSLRRERRFSPGDSMGYPSASGFDRYAQGRGDPSDTYSRYRWDESPDRWGRQAPSGPYLREGERDHGLPFSYDYAHGQTHRESRPEWSHMAHSTSSQALAHQLPPVLDVGRNSASGQSAPASGFPASASKVQSLPVTVPGTPGVQGSPSSRDIAGVRRVVRLASGPKPKRKQTAGKPSAPTASAGLRKRRQPPNSTSTSGDNTSLLPTKESTGELRSGKRSKPSQEVDRACHDPPVLPVTPPEADSAASCDPSPSRSETSLSETMSLHPDSDEGFTVERGSALLAEEPDTVGVAADPIIVNDGLSRMRRVRQLIREKVSESFVPPPSKGPSSTAKRQFWKPFQTDEVAEDPESPEIESLPMGACVQSELKLLNEALQGTQTPGHMRSSVEGLPPLGTGAMTKVGKMFSASSPPLGEYRDAYYKLHDSEFLTRVVKYEGEDKNLFRMSDQDFRSYKVAEDDELLAKNQVRVLSYADHTLHAVEQCMPAGASNDSDLRILFESLALSIAHASSLALRSAANLTLRRRDLLLQSKHPLCREVCNALRTAPLEGDFLFTDRIPEALAAQQKIAEHLPSKKGPTSKTGAPRPQPGRGRQQGKGSGSQTASQSAAQGSSQAPKPRQKNRGKKRSGKGNQKPQAKPSARGSSQKRR